MKKALGFAAKILFYVMIGVLLVLNANYTLTFVDALFPGDFIKPWGSLMIFDAGAIIWFLIFLTIAEGAGQRGVSLLGGVVDLVGSLIIAGAEVFGAAQAYMSDPVMYNGLKTTATWVLFIWLGVNIALTWIFHITHPKQQQDMRARNIKDDTVAKALDMAEAKVNQVASILADELSDGMYTDILAQLNITNRALLPKPKEQPKEVIDAKAKDAAVPAPPKYTQRKSANPSLRRTASYASETITPVVDTPKAEQGSEDPEDFTQPR